MSATIYSPSYKEQVDILDIAKSACCLNAPYDLTEQDCQGTDTIDSRTVKSYRGPSIVSDDTGTPQRTKMSESALERWLEYFADDGDGEALCSQWLGWSRLNMDLDSVMSWLLERGLENCQRAAGVKAVLEQLLSCGHIDGQMVERSLSVFSQEVLEDFALDNPQVTFFVQEVRDVAAKEVALRDRGRYDRSTMLSLRHGNSAEIGWRVELVPVPKPSVESVSVSIPKAPCPEWRADRGTTGQSTSWVSQRKRVGQGSDTEDEHAPFVREMHLILNKLTVDKFPQLSAHVLSLISKSQRPHHGIPVLVQMVFEKATVQHHFIDMYVNLCVKLHDWLTEKNMSLEADCNFKRILLNQCQISFEEYLEPPTFGSELYEQQVKYKTKMLGNIKLVGELIRRGMLVRKIALSIASDLVQAPVHAERLEALAVFLETAGPSLDEPTWSHYQQFNAIFSEVTRIAQSDETPVRTRCLLKDVLDLRQSRWQMRKIRKFDEDAPTTIAQVHKKAALKTPEVRTDRFRQSKMLPLSSVRSQLDIVAKGVPVSPSSPASPTSPDSRVAAAASATSASQQTPNKTCKTFRQEIMYLTRHLGKGVDLRAALQRLRDCPLPAASIVEETADILARFVDEPKARRQELFPLIPALFALGIFAGRLVDAVELFLSIAFGDPGCLDPPNLCDITFNEMLPALGLTPSKLTLPPCLLDLLDDVQGCRAT